MTFAGTPVDVIASIADGGGFTSITIDGRSVHITSDGTGTTGSIILNLSNAIKQSWAYALRFNASSPDSIFPSGEILFDGDVDVRESFSITPGLNHATVEIGGDEGDYGQAIVILRLDTSIAFDVTLDVVKFVEGVVVTFENADIPLEPQWLTEDGLPFVSGTDDTTEYTYDGTSGEFTFTWLGGWATIAFSCNAHSTAMIEAVLEVTEVNPVDEDFAPELCFWSNVNGTAGDPIDDKFINAPGTYIVRGKPNNSTGEGLLVGFRTQYQGSLTISSVTIRYWGVSASCSAYSTGEDDALSFVPDADNSVDYSDGVLTWVVNTLDDEGYATLDIERKTGAHSGFWFENLVDLPSVPYMNVCFERMPATRGNRFYSFYQYEHTSFPLTVYAIGTYQWRFGIINSGWLQRYNAIQRWQENEYAPAQYLYDPAFKDICVGGFDDTTWDITYGPDYLELTDLVDGRLIQIGASFPVWMRVNVTMDIDPLTNTEVEIGTTQSTNTAGQKAEVFVTSPGTYTFSTINDPEDNDNMAFVYVDTGGAGLPFRVSNVSITVEHPDGLQWDETQNLFAEFYSSVRGPFDDSVIDYSVENNIIDVNVVSMDAASSNTVLRFDPPDTPPVNALGWVMLVTSLGDSTHTGRISNLGRGFTCWPMHDGGQILGMVYSGATGLQDLEFDYTDTPGHGRWLVEIYPITSLPKNYTVDHDILASVTAPSGTPIQIDHDTAATIATDIQIDHDTKAQVREQGIWWRRFDAAASVSTAYELQIDHDTAASIATAYEFQVDHDTRATIVYGVQVDHDTNASVATAYPVQTDHDTTATTIYGVEHDTAASVAYQVNIQVDHDARAMIVYGVQVDHDTNASIATAYPVQTDHDTHASITIDYAIEHDTSATIRVGLLTDHDTAAAIATAYQVQTDHDTEAQVREHGIWWRRFDASASVSTAYQVQTDHDTRASIITQGTIQTDHDTVAHITIDYAVDHDTRASTITQGMIQVDHDTEAHITIDYAIEHDTRASTITQGTIQVDHDTGAHITIDYAIEHDTIATIETTGEIRIDHDTVATIRTAYQIQVNHDTLCFVFYGTGGIIEEKRYYTPITVEKRFDSHITLEKRFKVKVVK